MRQRYETTTTHCNLAQRLAARVAFAISGALTLRVGPSSVSNRHGYDCHQGLLARNLFLAERFPLAGVAPQNGTIRFGKDPQTSALDRHCKAPDVDNLYVVDGSFFCSSAAVNPALTIMANASGWVITCWND